MEPEVAKAATRRVSLTKQRIEDFGPSEGQTQAFLWDSAVPSLAVRATRGGSKAFVFQSKLRGEVIRITIGSVDDWHIDDRDAGKSARKEARRLRTLVDQGFDPRTERKERDEAAHAAKVRANLEETTLRDVWPAYIEAHKAHWGARHLLDHQRLADPGGRKALRGDRKTDPGALAGIMHLPLTRIDAEAVQAWLTLEAKTRPTQARLALGALRACLNWLAESATYRSLIHEGACARRVAERTLPKKGAKSDSLQREQLPAWFAAVRALPDPVVSAYLQGLLLTGARREELATLRWEGVDLKWKTLRIRDKVDGERVIPLTAYMAALLRGLKTINEKPRLGQNGVVDPDWRPSPWVYFSDRSADGRLVEPRLGHNRALASAGLPHVSLHGLRRSFATLSEWVEVPTGVVAQIMGHKPSATAERHYKVRPIDLLRKWHQSIETWTLQQAKVRTPRPKKQGE